MTSNRFPLYVPLIGKDQLSPMLARVGGRLGQIGGGINKVGRSMSRGLTLPAVAAGAAIFSTGANFARALNRVRALSGATGKDLKALENQALELGRTTEHSATDAANAQATLAQAGFKTKETLATLPGVLNLASAGAVDLGSASSIMANVLRGYNLDASKSAMVTDVLTKAQASGNIQVFELGEGFQKVGPLAASAGIAFTETAAALTLLGDSGFQGADGGTAFRTMLLNISSLTPHAKSVVQELGIDMGKILDERGNVRSVRALVQEFEKADATVAQLNAVFGKRAVAPFQALLARGVDDLDALDKKLRSSTGEAARVAKINLDGAGGAVARFSSSLDGLMQKIGKSGLLDQVTAALTVVTDQLGELAKTDPELLKLGTTMILVGAVAAPMISILGTGITVLGGLTTGGKLLLPVLRAAWLLMATNPVGVVIIALATLAGGIAYVASKWDSSLSVWGNVKARLADVGNTILDMLIAPLKWLGEWILPESLQRLLGLGGSKIEIDANGGEPLTGNQQRHLAGNVAASAAARAMGMAALKIELVDPEGRLKINELESDNLDTSVSRGVGAQGVTG